jgi:hypothetical protein
MRIIPTWGTPTDRNNRHLDSAGQGIVDRGAGHQLGGFTQPLTLAMQPLNFIKSQVCSTGDAHQQRIGVIQCQSCLEKWMGLQTLNGIPGSVFTTGLNGGKRALGVPSPQETLDICEAQGYHARSSDCLPDSRDAVCKKAVGRGVDFREKRFFRKKSGDPLIWNAHDCIRFTPQALQSFIRLGSSAESLKIKG